MGSRNLDEDSILAALLKSDNELPSEDNDSEDFRDEVQEKQPMPSGNEEQSIVKQPVSKSASNRILALPQRTIRGKNKHCSSTSKSTSLSTEYC